METVVAPTWKRSSAPTWKWSSHKHGYGHWHQHGNGCRTNMDTVVGTNMETGIYREEIDTLEELMYSKSPSKQSSTPTWKRSSHQHGNGRCTNMETWKKLTPWKSLCIPSRKLVAFLPLPKSMFGKCGRPIQWCVGTKPVPDKSEFF